MAAKSGRRDARRSFGLPHATAPASWWAGPAPVRRPCRNKLARSRGIESPDPARPRAGGRTRIFARKLHRRSSRRDALVWAAARDGPGQLVSWAGSSTQGLSKEARAQPRHRVARPALQHATTRCWTSAPAELHSIVNTPSCLAQPRTPLSPCSSRQSASDRMKWTSSLACECVLVMNGRAGSDGDGEITSRVVRWVRGLANDEVPCDCSDRLASSRTRRRSAAGKERLSPNH